MKTIYENGKLYKVVEIKEEINIDEILKENKELKSKGTNTGNGNTGCGNTGSWNTGSWNTGSWNTGSWNPGYFNIDTPQTIRCFGVEVDRDLWDNSYKPRWLFFDLTEWINEEEMTNGGFLKQYDYKEAFQRSYEKASQEDREAVKKLPGFNSDIFFEISGIRI